MNQRWTSNERVITNFRYWIQNYLNFLNMNKMHKAQFTIEVTELEKNIYFNDEHLMKVFYSIIFTEDGIN